MVVSSVSRVDAKLDILVVFLVFEERMTILAVALLDIGL